MTFSIITTAQRVYVLAREVEGIGIRVREVLPGRAPSTPFGAKGRARMHLPDAYRPVAEALMAGWQTHGPVTTPDLADFGMDRGSLHTIAREHVYGDKT